MDCQSAIQRRLGCDASNMSIFRDVSVPFAGRDYVVTPSNRLLRRIEAKGRLDDPSFNLMAVFYRATTSSAGMNDLAFVMAEFINASGGQVTEDDALAQLMGFEKPVEMREYINLICGLVVPEPKEVDEKKPEAPPKAEK